MNQCVSSRVTGRESGREGTQETRGAELPGRVSPPREELLVFARHARGLAVVFAKPSSHSVLEQVITFRSLTTVYSYRIQTRGPPTAAAAAAAAAAS